MKEELETAAERWRTLVAADHTAEEHACLIRARRTVPAELADEAYALDALAVYTDLLAAGRYAHLNRELPTAVHAAILRRIAQAGGDGLYANKVLGQVRMMMARRGWVTASDREGRPMPARDWTSILRTTVEGEAVAAAVLDRPVELSDTLAAALLAVAGGGPDGYHGPWPGARDTLPVAEAFKLVTSRVVRKDFPPEWFLVTTAGIDALARWRAEPRTEATPTTAQYHLLTELAKGRTAQRMRSYPSGTYDACERNGWLLWGPVVDGRRKCQITKAGVLARGRYTPNVKQSPRRSTHPRARVTELEAGQVVRLANRKGWRLGPEWVTVRELEKVPGQGRKPGGWHVLIWRDGEVVPYGGKPFASTQKFEVKG